MIMDVQIKTMDLVQLKSEAYDIFVEIQLLQDNLREISNKIQSLKK